MSDIYQQIWDADQTGNGVRPVQPNADTTSLETTGFVVVETTPDDPKPDFRVLSKVHIPDDKRKTYEIATKLFDNYTLAEPEPENETQEERNEVHELLEAVVDTPPMIVARRFLEEATNASISSGRMYSLLLEHWFRRFSSGGDPDLSGFEHVIAGEQERGKVQGYHFWYKYWLDDGFASKIDRNKFPGLSDDRIRYLRDESSNGQSAFPESVTIAYQWDAPDYDAKAIRKLTKPKGGFFVGCSVEGLMAMGTVRAHVAARAPKEAVINGGRYELAIARSPSNQNIRTFFPKLLGAAAGVPPTQPIEPPPAGDPPSGPEPTTNAPVRIVAALVNPKGADPGHESVTLVNTGPKAVSLGGWSLRDQQNKRLVIDALTLSSGHSATITLPNNAAQLSNKGGEIRLLDANGALVHRVSYSKAQAAREGETIVF